MSKTALLIGGPRDGEVLAIRDDRTEIAVVLFADPVRWDAMGPFVETDDPTEPVAFRTTSYWRRTLVLFGQRMAVWVNEGFTDSGLDMAVSRHLLSPLAHKLIEEGR